jgi:hypothetical protein
MFGAIRLPLLALGLVAALAACTSTAGGPGVATLNDPAASASSAPSSAPTDPQEAFLAYARCMRDNGIEMPDPEVVEGTGGDVRVSMGMDGEGDGGNVDKEKFRAADATCKPLLAHAVGNGTKGGMSPEDEEKLLQFARCMREHGVDMPDPQQGGMIIDEQQGNGPKLDPNDADFQAAEAACSSLLPGKLGKPSLDGKPGSDGKVSPPGGGTVEAVPAPTVAK